MNREIKFRAWDKKNKQMINYIPVILFEDANPSISLTSRDWIHNSQDWEMLYANEIELMQFTGLTDKDGKDIYEGDVLKHEDTRNGYDSEYWQVIFYSGAFFIAGLPNKIRIYNMGDRLNSLEIVGNIYEHPKFINP